MASHSFHHGLEGYDMRQIFADGCEECERRGANPQLALTLMDPWIFVKAWNRAFDVYRNADVGHIADAERLLLGALVGVQIQLQKRGIAMDGNPPGYTPEIGRYDD